VASVYRVLKQQAVPLSRVNVLSARVTARNQSVVGQHK
jgi:hypothetical protein